MGLKENVLNLIFLDQIKYQAEKIINLAFIIQRKHSSCDLLTLSTYEIINLFCYAFLKFIPVFSSIFLQIHNFKRIDSLEEGS